MSVSDKRQDKQQRCAFEVMQDGGLNNGAVMACPEPVERSMWFQGQHVRVCKIHAQIVEEAERQAKGQALKQAITDLNALSRINCEITGLVN